MVMRIMLFAGVLPSVLVCSTIAQSKPDRRTASTPESTILAMERASLDRSDKGDPGGFLEISDPDVVYIDPTLEQPIHGLEALRAYYHKSFGSEQGSGEIFNPKVQVSADTAVLTFNYVFKSEKTQHTTRWNATEVYRQTKDGWRIIHTHWSYLKPEIVKQP